MRAVVVVVPVTDAGCSDGASVSTAGGSSVSTSVGAASLGNSPGDSGTFGLSISSLPDLESPALNQHQQSGLDWCFCHHQHILLLPV